MDSKIAYSAFGIDLLNTLAEHLTVIVRCGSGAKATIERSAKHYLRAEREECAVFWHCRVSRYLGRTRRAMPLDRTWSVLRQIGKLGWWHSIAALLIILVAVLVIPASAAARRAVVVEVDGAIGPAITDYVSRELAAVRPSDTSLVILRMNTPGGLDTSMREIIRAVLASPVPVAAYVAPSGARAASAGTYIVYACAIAAMAQGTNLGAATPVRLAALPLLPSGQPQPPAKGSEGKEPTSAGNSGTPSNAEPDDTETRKILNDAVAYIRSLAELNGRNADWATDAVRSAVSLSAADALRLHVIDAIADDVPDLLRKIDGRTVKVAGKPEQLVTAGLTVVTVAPDWRTQLLAVITNPNIAYLLMLLGAYGLIFELSNPGMVLPGMIGAISLLVALFALNLLPTDYAGAGLVLLGIALMVAEAFIGTFGVLGIGGIVAFIFGSVMMFHADGSGFGLSISVLVAATVFSAGFFLLVLTMLVRSRRRPVVTGGEALIGAEGETVAWEGTAGTARVNGEIWQARSQNPLQPGAPITVVTRDGLILTVGPHR
jgi:membrane-bound serine protease (ClpP class)